MGEKMRIFVVCSYALSSSLLADKMQQLAKERGMAVEIQFVSPDQLKDKMDQCDVVLLSPQVRFNRTVFQKLLEPEGIPIVDIPMQVYGLMDAEEAIALAAKAHQRTKSKGED
jgi:PTS system cellobiose-specific IIB component